MQIGKGYGMRIAIIGKKAPFCGIVTYCRELVARLRARGHTVAFFYLGNGEEAEALPYMVRTPIYTLPAPGARSALAEQLAAFRPDVVHANFALSFLDLAVPGICEELGAPLVATFHVAFDSRPSLPNQVSAFGYRMYARTLSRCERVVVFSEPQRKRLVACGVPEDRVAILPNGVDVERYSPGPSRFKREVGARVLLSYMGRIDPEKNVGSLLSAFSKLQPAPDVHLALMGDGVLASALEKKYADHPQIHWLGYVADEQRRIDVLRGSDMFVLPSSVEGLSLALLEAMACGAAPVATDVGGDGEVVRGCGRVLAPRRLRSQLGRVLGELLARPDEVAGLGRLARERVLERYAIDGNLDRLEAIYEEAAGARVLITRLEAAGREARRPRR